MEKIELTDEQINHIAEKAAEVAFKKIYEEVGRSVVKKIFWIIGVGSLGLLPLLLHLKPPRLPLTCASVALLYIKR
jgi:hypothetical protein